MCFGEGMSVQASPTIYMRRRPGSLQVSYVYSIPSVSACSYSEVFSYELLIISSWGYPYLATKMHLHSCWGT